MEILFERFEAWLLAQPDDRQFRYSDPRDCLVCMFIKETSRHQHPEVLPMKYRVGGGDWRPLPAFIRDEDLGSSLLHLGAFDGKHWPFYTFGDAKKRWLEIFPSSLPQPQKEGVKA